MVSPYRRWYGPGGYPPGIARSPGPRPKKKPPGGGFLASEVCLTMSYFHERGLTIIGATAFHGPVRDGKGWFHRAMVVRHDLLPRKRSLPKEAVSRGQFDRRFRLSRSQHQPRVEVSVTTHRVMRMRIRGMRCALPLLRRAMREVSCTHTHCDRAGSILQSYRVKPHGQLVSVSLTHYCASTPDLSTSWSRTTLQGDRVPREISSSGEFPA